MSATVLAGKELAGSIRAEAAARTAELAAAGTTPKLAVVVATADESSAWYVRSIARTAEKLGMACDVVDLVAEVGAEVGAAAAETIRATLTRLGADDTVHGILLQTPLPAGTALADLSAAIPPGKDVDGANPLSLGRLVAGLEAFAPATAEAVIAILDHYQVELSGRHAVVIGRSTVVGKPVAALLLDRDATVTVCHSRTAELAAVTSAADVLVAAVGRAGLVGAQHVKRGAIVVDVGTNPTDDGGLVGDVDAASVTDHAAALTPVPGGIGPVTTALLLQHTIQAATR
ncbi:MAG: bifunctional 5,10-methylenetetrahydrofolate dehydrogenase/5,10-methenyltetrahydrofolate cyclohydrolase [Pseudonocardiaceae bacterium]